MSTPLLYWKKLYEDLKHSAVCIDIERMWFNGPIAVIGWYEIAEGVIECNHFIRGDNLTVENLRAAFGKYKLLVTYNGLRYDIPAIEREFPGVFAPNRKILDLYILSRKLQLNISLKTWENTLGIERPNTIPGQRARPLRMWKRYQYRGGHAQLLRLLEHNAQDAINLYPLAERLMSFIGQPTPIFMDF